MHTCCVVNKGTICCTCICTSHIYVELKWCLKTIITATYIHLVYLLDLIQVTYYVLCETSVDL